MRNVPVNLHSIRGIMGCCHLLEDGDASVMIDTGMIGEPLLIRLWPETPVFRISVREEWPPRVGEALIFRSLIPKPSTFPGDSDTAPSDLACGFAAGRFRPPGVRFQFAPVPMPAIPAR
jgi:hypothetical protein